MKENKSNLEQYAPFIVTAYLLVFILRCTEFSIVSVLYGFKVSWLNKEVLGLVYDFILISGVLALYFPLFNVLNKSKPKFARNSTLFIFSLFSIFHLLILGYFVHELAPVDIFLYKHPFEEIYFTVTTSLNFPLWWFIPVLVGLISLPILVYKLVIARLKKQTAKNFTKYSLITGTILTIVILLFPTDKLNVFTQNKSFYFYYNSIEYALSPTPYYENLNETNVAFFQSLYPHKNFISKKYPLVYERSTNNELQEYLNDFDTVPNVVLLIVEGLNDDFVQKKYHGIELMPFLNSLKDSSLYWSHCFTLGERSYAAVPSITGGLPYGDRGFTLLESYPRHHSLVNLLKAKNYHAGFYSGQDTWFHRNREYMRYDNADWIFDKMDFDNSYEKIIVGDNNYFWGYNDKDLFSQYFKTIDTLQNPSYLNILFTGTSHSPYIIPDKKEYEKKLNQFKTKENSSFIRTYSKYLESVLFVDDAIRDFFKAYQKKEGYENTLFIITGDHPATELPRENELKKYHVPLIVYSPKLKKGKVFEHPVSHLDISPTLLNFLEGYTECFPTETTALGYSLFDINPNITRKYSFMSGNRELIEYYSDGYFLRKDKLYKVDNKLNISPANDKNKKEELKKELENFKTINHWVSYDNKIMDNSVFVSGVGKQLLFEKRDSPHLISTDEFITIVPPTEIPKGKIRAEINFDLNKYIKLGCSMVFQVNSGDSIVSWENRGIQEVGNYQLNYEVNIPSSLDSPITFTIMIWNKEKLKLNSENFDILVWSDF